MTCIYWEVLWRTPSSSYAIVFHTARSNVITIWKQYLWNKGPLKHYVRKVLDSLHRESCNFLHSDSYIVWEYPYFSFTSSATFSAFYYKTRTACFENVSRATSDLLLIYFPRSKFTSLVQTVLNPAVLFAFTTHM